MIKEFFILCSLLLYSVTSIASIHRCDVLTIPQDVKNKIKEYCEGKEYCGFSVPYQTNKDNKLIAAARYGEISLIEKNINAGVDVNNIFSRSCRAGFNIQTQTYNVFEQGYVSLLTESLTNNHLNIAELLLDNGANLSILSTQGQYVLDEVSESNNLKTFEFILEKSNNDPKLLASFLGPVINANNITMLNELIKSGVNISTIEEYYLPSSLLEGIPSNTSAEDRIQLLNILINNGLNLKKYTKNSFIIFLRAAQTNSVAFLNFLLQSDLKKPENLEIIIKIVEDEGNEDILEILQKYIE